MNHCANTKFEHASMLALAMWQNTFRRTDAQTQTQTQTQTQKHALIFACIHVYYLHFQLCACLLFHFLLQPKSIIMADKQQLAAQELQELKAGMEKGHCTGTTSAGHVLHFWLCQRADIETRAIIT